MARRVADRYVLAEQIGTGGSARVFAALDERLQRRVAVKLLDAGLADPAGRARFLREGPTSAAVMHRHAVAVFDAGEDDGELFIVMELVEGPSLAQHLATHGPLDATDAIRIATQVLAALAPAHAGGIVHRDVKPGNILLAPSGDAKLTDFGIAKRFDDLDESVTRTGTTIGTPRYLSPEQATGGPLSPATDLYAVGLVLFEMLTGRTPFVGDSPVAVALAQQTQAAPDVRELRPDVPATLAAVINRSLSKSPAERYETVDEMRGALTSSWSPPPGPLPASATPTQVIEQAPLVAARSGHTEVIPTAVVEPEPPTPSPTRRFPWAMVAVVAAVVVLAIVAALRSRDGAAGITGATTVTTLPTVQATNPPSSAPATAAPTTAAPATTGPTVDEIIPGFPRVADLPAFLQQLETDPSLVGSAGDALAESLVRLLDAKAKQQRDQATALTRRLSDWVDAGEIHPAIAQSLVELLAPLAEKPKP